MTIEDTCGGAAVLEVALSLVFTSAVPSVPSAVQQSLQLAQMCHIVLISPLIQY